MTETQCNTAAELGLILEEAADETESAGADDDGQAGASIDQHEQIEGAPRVRRTWGTYMTSPPQHLGQHVRNG